MSNPQQDQFNSQLDLYKYQVDLAIKIAPAVLTIAGSLLAFIATRQGLPTWASRLSLTIPLLLCVGFVAMYWFATEGAKDLRDNHKSTSRALGVQAFNFDLLVGVCRLGYLLCGLVAFGLLSVMYSVDIFNTPSEQASEVAFVCKPK